MSDATHPATGFLAGLVDHDVDRRRAAAAPGLSASFEAGRDR